MWPLVAPSLPGRDLLAVVGAHSQRADRVRHIEVVPARVGRTTSWPSWADPGLVAALGVRGVGAPWTHQVEAAGLAHDGQHVVVATGTASGKSLAYLLPALSDLLAPAGFSVCPPTTLYLSPTKALAGDQLSSLESLGLPGLRAATYDGDTPIDERRWVRDHAAYVLTNPDLLHHSLLPGHQRWAGFLRGLRYVVVDECHHYRGVFGSHVAAVLRRLRRVAARYGAHPVFVLCSATVSSPALHASRLTGLDVHEVTADGSPRGRTDVVLWEPPLLPGGGEHDAPTRRTATAETADLLADLVAGGVRTLAFVRSRRGVETVAATTRRLLAEVDPSLPARVAGYRGGYLPEERRALERGLRSGDLLGVAATNALELGVDVAGLDAVLLAGWPGRRASMWQQVGRAGRAGQDALAVLVAADDPLDTYLVNHPAAVFGAPVEQTVLDPDNPYVLAPHLAAAAAELPLTEADLPVFGPTAGSLLEVLVARGLLRRRPGGWFWARPERATDHVDLRGSGGTAYRVVESATGRVLGTVDAAAADRSVHQGAVYVHQGAIFVVQRLDLAEHLALVVRVAGLDDPRPHRHRRTPVEDAAAPDLGAGRARLRRGRGDHPGRLVLAPTAGERRGARRGTARSAGPNPQHQGGVVDDGPGGARARGRRRERPAGCPARRRARVDRAAAARGDLRPVGRRRRLDGAAPRHRAAHRRGARRAPRGRRLRRAWVRGGPHLVAGHPGRGRLVRLLGRVPVVRAVAQVRQRQRAARQGRGHGCAAAVALACSSPGRTGASGLALLPRLPISAGVSTRRNVMIALALLCLLLAAAAVAFMVAVGTTQVVSFSFFAGDFVTNPVWIFVAGAVAMLLTLAAIAFLRRGTARKSAQRREIKRLRKVEETSGPAPTDTRHDVGRDVRDDNSSRRSGADEATRRPDADETLVREPRPAGDEGTRRS